jgi:hypothetical protein
VKIIKIKALDLKFYFSKMSPLKRLKQIYVIVFGITNALKDEMTEQVLFEIKKQF